MVISPERCKHVVWERQDILVVFQAVVFVTGPVQDLHALRTANLRSEFWINTILMRRLQHTLTLTFWWPESMWSLSLFKLKKVLWHFGQEKMFPEGLESGFFMPYILDGIASRALICVSLCMEFVSFSSFLSNLTGWLVTLMLDLPPSSSLQVRKMSFQNVQTR